MKLNTKRDESVVFEETGPKHTHKKVYNVLLNDPGLICESRDRVYRNLNVHPANQGSGD
jgi:hypothetical protein